MEFEERYYRQELDYLRQLSKLLATENRIWPGFWQKKEPIRILSVCWKAWPFSQAICARKLRMNFLN